MPGQGLFSCRSSACAPLVGGQLAPAGSAGRTRMRFQLLACLSLCPSLCPILSLGSACPARHLSLQAILCSQVPGTSWCWVPLAGSTAGSAHFPAYPCKDRVALPPPPSRPPRATLLCVHVLSAEVSLTLAQPAHRLPPCPLNPWGGQERAAPCETIAGSVVLGVVLYSDQYVACSPSAVL